jgi:hypothetical protein
MVLCKALKNKAQALTGRDIFIFFCKHFPNRKCKRPRNKTHTGRENGMRINESHV